MRSIQLLVVALCVIFFSGKVYAQSAITFAGGTLESSDMSLSFTAGEAISGSFEGSNMSVGGGFVMSRNTVPVSNERERGDVPAVFRLNQNYPNPFNPSTNITFDLPKAADVTLEVFNSIGAKVAVLESGRKAAGYHSLRFEAGHMSSGMYFYRLTANGKVISTKKMLLIK